MMQCDPAYLFSLVGGLLSQMDSSVIHSLNFKGRDTGGGLFASSVVVGDGDCSVTVPGEGDSDDGSDAASGKSPLHAVNAAINPASRQAMTSGFQYRSPFIIRLTPIV